MLSTDDITEYLSDVESLEFIGKISLPIEKDNLIYFSVTFRINEPRDGIYPGIKAQEEIHICCEKASYDNFGPSPYVRLNFPRIPHQNIFQIRGSEFKEICLSNIAKQDWWSGKTFYEFILAIRDWLNDAAADNLVRDDDLYEPLIGDPTLPSIEINLPLIRSNCVKGDGIFYTKASKLEQKLLSLGCGPTKTLVLFQERQVHEPWVKKPGSIKSLLAMLDQAQFSRSRIRSFLEIGKKKKEKSDKLLVVGVNRTKRVFSRTNTEEWTAFSVSRDKQTGVKRVGTHNVSEVFTKDFARRLSNFPKPHATATVLLIGAGALGSSVAELLARSGHVNLKIVDCDSLAHHNLARHTLTASSIGSRKACDVSLRLNSIYPCETIALDHPYINRDFLGLSKDELCQLLNGIDLVLDCSASIAVLRFLSYELYLDVPIASGFQISDRGDAFFLFSPNPVSQPLSGIESVGITKWRDQPIIKNWLSETTDTLAIGGGCRSASAMIPFTRMMHTACVISDRILTYISSAELPDRGRVEILEFPSESTDDNNHKKIHDIGFTRNNIGSWIIYMSEEVELQINDLAQENCEAETGGILIGQLDKQKKVILVTGIVEIHGKKRPTVFERNNDGLIHLLAKVENQTSGLIHYVGEWHTHPASSDTSLSNTDSETISEIVSDLAEERVPALCVISNGDNIAVHMVEHPAEAPI